MNWIVSIQLTELQPTGIALKTVAVLSELMVPTENFFSRLSVGLMFTESFFVYHVLDRTQ